MSRSYEFSKAANSQPLEVPWGMEGVTPDPSAWWSDRAKTPDVLTKAASVDKLDRFRAIGDLPVADWGDARKLEPLFEGIDEWRVVAKDKSKTAGQGELKNDWHIEDIKPPKAGTKNKKGEVVGEAPPEIDLVRRVIHDDGTEGEIRRSIPYPDFMQAQVDAENAKRTKVAEQVAERVSWVENLPGGPSSTPLDAITSLEQNADDDAEIGDTLGRKYLIRRFRRNIVHRIVELDGKLDLHKAENGLAHAKRRRDAATNPALRALRQRDVDLAERIKQGVHNRQARNDMQQHEYLAGLKHKRSDALAEKRMWSELRGSQNATKHEARQIIDRMPREQRDRIGRLVLAEYAADRRQQRATRPIKKLDKAYNRSEKRFEKAEVNHREAERAKNRALNEIASIEATRLPAAEQTLEDARQAVRNYLGHNTEERMRLVQARDDAHTKLMGIRDELNRLRKTADDYREKRKLERAKYNHYRGQATSYDQQREAVQHTNDSLADASSFAHVRTNQQAAHGYYVTGRRINKRNEAIRRAAMARRLAAATVKPKDEGKDKKKAKKSS